ncbi:sugar-binding protein [Actinosynnema sp. NPDC020468]|uniref:sugar-binding protein n=1 Tax=Actinosynnema sp. NPDC020468 TaxID=3154488 RepID=UPI0033CACEC8
MSLYRKVFPLALVAVTGLAPAAPAVAEDDPAHVDVLFVGAHPDDELRSLAAFGQWREQRGLRTAVATITRGEGSGVGPEQGAALGLLREGEERAATGIADVDDVYYLDRPDLWRTPSVPLTDRVWSGDVLGRLVRLIRATTPDVVVTTDPRPAEDGGDQLAGRLTTEAFLLAGDPTAYPDQLTREGYRPWRATRLLTQSAYQGPPGPGCATDQRDPRTGLPLEGTAEGTWSPTHRATWAQVERDAARRHRSQGLDALPPVVADPNGCDWFTVLADAGVPVRADVREQTGLRPRYAEFRDWTRRVGLPWLANDAQPGYPARVVSTVPQAGFEPILDGVNDPFDFPGQELTLTRRRGEECAEDDCTATAHLSWFGNALYAVVEVTDDARGPEPDPADCGRFLDADAVEIALDPRGTSDDTSTTYRLAVAPTAGKPCVARRGDHDQGPATGVSVVVEPGADAGYVVEARIPFAVLPATVDPFRLAANVVVHDVDPTSRTTLAWSTFGEAATDPYTWGTAHLDRHRPAPVTTTAPVFPLDALRSQDSPASVAQSARTGVPLGVGPRG